jgi:hypothetical protein
VDIFQGHLSRVGLNEWGLGHWAIGWASNLEGGRRVESNSWEPGVGRGPGRDRAAIRAADTRFGNDSRGRVPGFNTLEAGVLGGTPFGAAGGRAPFPGGEDLARGERAQVTWFSPETEPGFGGSTWLFDPVQTPAC